MEGSLMRLWRYGHAIEDLGQRYHLEGFLGSGGMADVCLARDEQEKREVVIKLIKTDELDQRVLDRFVQDTARIMQWHHPNILHIYGDLASELIDQTQAVPYIVMEYAEGGDLQKRLNPGRPHPLSAILSIFPQLCSAISHAHEHGIIHRNLKPSNVLFRILPDDTEQVVVSDFGLAVEVDAAHYTYARGSTLPYMAPEQLRGQPLPASDIIALGVILYQLCTGRLPFRRTLLDLRPDEPLKPPLSPSLLQPLLPRELDEVIFTALADDSKQRFSDATQFWESAHTALLSPPVRASHIHQIVFRSASSFPDDWRQSGISDCPQSRRGEQQGENADSEPEGGDVENPPGSVQ
jgi:serine/threonine-protein kinase